MFIPSPGKPFDLAALRMARGRLLVRPIADTARSKGGLHLAETSSRRDVPSRGVVVTVGPPQVTEDGIGLRPVDSVPGQVVFFGRHAGYEMELDGLTYLNMTELEISARLSPSDFTLVRHDDPRRDHLQGDYCDLCAAPEEAEAKANLARMRELAVRVGEQFSAMGNLGVKSADAPTAPEPAS